MMPSAIGISAMKIECCLIIIARPRTIPTVPRKVVS